MTDHENNTLTETTLDTDSANEVMLLGASTLAAMESSAISQQIAAARANPRDLTKFRKTAAALVTQDADTAASMIYSLPKGWELDRQGKKVRKIVKGASIRFAEAIAYSWGNSRWQARIVDVGDTFVTAMGMYFDVQTNIAIGFEVRRSILDKEGRRYKEDMVTMTCNAAASIALRNAILKGIPRPAWKGLYEMAEQTIRGDRKTLVDRRQSVLDQFKAFGITVSQAAELCGANGLAEIQEDQLVILHGMLTALVDGETTVEMLMSQTDSGKAASQADEQLKSVKDKYPPKTKAGKKAASAPPAEQQPDKPKNGKQAQQSLGEDTW